MHLSTFATRHIVAGWVIDATKADGQVEQLVGVYLRKKDAIVWMAEHTAEWFRLHPQIKAGLSGELTGIDPESSRRGHP